MIKLAAALLLCFSMSVASEKVYSYTGDEITKMASLYVYAAYNQAQMMQKPQELAKAFEFRGYVASILDNTISFDGCIKTLRLNDIILSSAKLISSSNANKETSPPIKVLVALDIVCKTHQKEK